jgi:FkbM family methyltransferase
VPKQATKTAVSFGERALLAYARHFPLSSGKYRLVNKLWRRFAGATYWRDAELIYGGMRVYCDLEELIQRQFYFFGTYQLERDFLAVWQELAIRSRLIFDVGANAGIYSLVASVANRDADIHAFEPTPEIAAGLRLSRDRNALSNLTVAEMAVSDKAGDASLVHCDGGADNGGMNFIVEASGRPDDCIVAVTSLDLYCRDHAIEHIDLIKIDVQGQEAAVLRGAQGLLCNRKIGTVFVELNWFTHNEAGPAEELIAILAGHGFVFSPICGDPNWRCAGDWLRGYADIMARQQEPASIAA